MKDRLPVLTLAVASILSIMAPAGGSTTPYEGPPWNTSQIGISAEEFGGYRYSIALCTDPTMGFPWDTAGIPRHARIADAIEVWNGINGELRYYLSPTACSALEANGTNTIRVKMGPLDGALGHTVPGIAGFCFEPWGNLCYNNEQMTFDSSLPAGTSWNTTTNPAGEQEYDFESAVIHELGHSTWCTRHSTDLADVMYRRLPPGTTKRLLSANDQLCYKHYYGSTH